MYVESLSCHEPAFYSRVFVRRVVVHDDVHIQCLRHVLLDLSKDLVVKIDQQVQSRVGSIEFLGVNAVTREKLMESLPKPGEVFDRTKLDEFFKINRTILPPDVQETM